MPLLLTLRVCISMGSTGASGFGGIGVFWLRLLTGLKPGWRNAYLAIWAGFRIADGRPTRLAFLPAGERMGAQVDSCSSPRRP